MSRIIPIRPEDATGELKKTLDGVKAAFGAVPNGVKVLAVSPAALRGYLRFAGSVASGSLSKADRERVALLTAQRNECGYCLSAHTFAGRAAGVSETELLTSRRGHSKYARSAAVLEFAGSVIDPSATVSLKPASV